MKAVTTPPADSREHVEMLIPWYANGSLTAGERHEVERHLAECDQCRTALALEIRSAALMRENHETLECAPQSGWAQLAARLGEPGKAAPAVVAAPAAPARGQPLGRVFVLLAAQAAAIAALAFALFFLVIGRSSDGYRTLTQPEASVARDAPALRVVFADATSSASIRALLAHVHGTIRSGPSGQNVYTIELTPTAAAPAWNPDEAARWLRGQPQVLLAEPIGQVDPR